MAVQAIRLSNFLAFEDTGWIELCPIVFIHGNNSSGKSAIGHAFRVMRDTFGINNSTDQTFIQGIKGFSTLLHKNTLKADNYPIIIFHFRCSPSFGLGPKINDFSMYRNLNVDEKVSFIISLSFERNRDSDDDDIGKLISVSIDLPNKRKVSSDIGDVEVENILSIRLNSFDGSERQYQWVFSSQLLDINLAHSLLEQITLDENQAFPRMKSTNGSLFDLTRIEMTPEEAQDGDFDPYKNVNDPRNILRYINDLLQALTSDIAKLAESVKFISPLKPEKMLALVGEALDDQSHTNEPLELWVSKFDISSTTKMELINTLRDEKLQRAIQDKNFDDIEYAGTGVSLSLLYILLLMNIERDSLIFWEHPDAFLDPVKQMELMDALLIYALGDEKNSVIETHSEYMILRTMKRLRQYSKKRLPSQFRDMNLEINPEKVHIIVTQKESNSCSIILPSALNERGEITEWPGEFFGYGYVERFYDNAV